MAEGLPEHHASDEDEVKPPSEKSFGLTFAAVFSIIALLPLVHGGPVRWWALAIAAAFLALAFAAPAILVRPNRLWMRVGLLLHKVMNPVILGIMFALIVIPIGVIARLFGGKLLSPALDPEAKTYWTFREPPGPDADSIRNQF